jgi:hypothetical protein
MAAAIRSRQPAVNRMVQVPGGRLHLSDHPGQEPALVLLHGFPDDSRIYERLVPLLAPRRAVALDWLGYGRSDRTGSGPLGDAAHHQQLRAVLDALQLDRVALADLTRWPRCAPGPLHCLLRWSSRTPTSPPGAWRRWRCRSRWCSARPTTTSTPTWPASWLGCSGTRTCTLSRAPPTGPSGTSPQRSPGCSWRPRSGDPRDHPAQAVARQASTPSDHTTDPGHRRLGRDRPGHTSPRPATSCSPASTRGRWRPLPVAHPCIRLVILDITDPAAIDRAHQQVMVETRGYAGWTCWSAPPGILVFGPVEAVSGQQIRAQRPARPAAASFAAAVAGLR